METKLIAIAGASGDLGLRITEALCDKGLRVRALCRPNIKLAEREKLTGLGVEVVEADPASIWEMTTALAGASLVVSALNGLRDVIVERQSILLEAAIQAGVERFIPSDFSEDFTKTTTGRNRNLDLRKEFKRRLDEAPIQATTILNGAFMDMLGAEMPIVQPGIRRVLYWADPDQPLDFTTKNDVARYVAEVAAENHSPRILRVAGESLTANQLAEVMTEMTGKSYQSQWAGNVTTLGWMISVAKLVAPQHGEVFPAWQGMQYMRDMFSGQGRLFPLDRDRYAGFAWTSVKTNLGSRGVGQ